MDALTDLELEIVKFIAQGLSSREIAEKLGFAEQTIKNYLGEVYNRLGVKNRAELVQYANQQGLLNQEPPVGGQEK
jgi:DNA-binding CsgD family transcriptional regulator